MTAPAAAANEFLDLMCDLAEGRLAAPQAARLEELLEADPARQRQYVHFMLLVGGLHRIRGEGQAKGEGGRGREEERLDASPPPPSAFPLSAEPPIVIRISPTLPAPFTFDAFVGSPLFSYMAATVIMGVGLLFFWAWKVSLHDDAAVASHNSRGLTAPGRDASPELPPVGRITGMADCRWADPQNAPSAAAPVPLATRYELVSGLLEISYTSGAKVILQGPCTYEVDSATGGFLSLGKLTARVGKSEVRGQGSVPSPLSPLPSPLFAVRTPTAIVTDLGTEFGVEVSEEGTTTSHVFRGSVNVRTAAGGGRQAEVVLRQDEWTRVEKADGANASRLVRHTTAGISASFRRRLAEPPKVLDLLDIVAGGDGTGKHRERGIDPASGMEDPLFVTQSHTSDGRYKLTAWCRFIDGVFMPDRRIGPVQLDSAGHTFEGFPYTNGTAYGSIWPRAAEIRPEDRKADAMRWVYAMGRGEQFMPERRGLLALHSNAGITFNLEAMRMVYRGVRPARFHAVAGVADARPLVPTADGVADVWVFVDGRLKLNFMHLRPEDGSVALDVTLGPGDRFLTLVTTDGANGVPCDWVVYGDPVVRMAPTASDNPDATNAEHVHRDSAVAPENRKEGRPMGP